MTTIGDWIAAHDNPRLAFTTKEDDWAEGSHQCTLCGERTATAHLMCEAHRLPRGVGSDTNRGRAILAAADTRARMDRA